MNRAGRRHDRNETLADRRPRPLAEHAAPARGGGVLSRSFDRVTDFMYPSSIKGAMEEVPLNIKSQEADRLARDLAKATGESITTAVTIALQERLKRVRGRATPAWDIEIDE